MLIAALTYCGMNQNGHCHVAGGVEKQLQTSGFKPVYCHDVNAELYNEKEIDDLMAVEWGRTPSHPAEGMGSEL